MMLMITTKTLRRPLVPTSLSLALVGRALGFLAGGVRRVTLRLHPGGAAARAELTIERRDRVAAYRLHGRWLRWADAVSARVVARIEAPSATAAGARGMPRREEARP